MIRVLIVDDDFMVARIHRGFVERVDGFGVVGSARTGEDALRAVRELQPDLVLLDLYLPDLFGLDVVARLRASGETCDVIVISAAREADSVRAAVRHGVVSYLLKPFAFAELEERLRSYAAERATALEAEELTQEQVDRVVGGPRRPVPPVPLPKGLSPETAGSVERVLKGSGESVSASECAASVGVSRVSARRYLEHFVARGLAEVTLRYGATGRPERRYRWRG